MGIKEIATIGGIIVMCGGGFLSFGHLVANQEVAEENIEELESEVEETAEKIINIEKIDLEQSIIIERTIELLEKLEKKL